MAEATPSGSGGPIRVSAPSDDGTLAIRGGVGGISFQLEELVGGAEKLDELAGRLAGIEVEVRRIWEDLIPYQDLPRWTGTMALAAVGEAERSVQVVRTELQRISSQVRGCKGSYELAEAAAGLSRELGLTGLAVWGRQLLDLRLSPYPTREPVELVAGDIPAALGLLLGVPGYAASAAAVDYAARTHIDAAVPLVRSLAEQDPGWLRPRPIIGKRQESMPIELDASPAGLLERVRIIDERGAGYIEVIEVDNSGRKAYVVVIPGTQPRGGPGGDNPFDEAGVAEGLGYGSAQLSAAVLEALRNAGAEKGAPVVGVGYSQGGIHAMNLGADDLFLAEYDVSYILTAGSPVGSIESAPGITTLHLEHRQDWVPGADGAPGPDGRDRVTVTLNNEVRTPDGEDAGLGPGHRLSTYQDGARLVSQSGNPSLVESTAALGAILGTGGAANATRFALSRTKAPAPVPAPGDAQKPARGHAGR